jgi:hypothetical protein
MSAGSFKEASTGLQAALTGGTRKAILDEVSKAKTFDRAARHLRDFMRIHRFDASGTTLFSGRWVKHLDHVTRGEGFHALHDWDGKADRFNDDIIPVELTNFVERMIRPRDHAEGRFVLALLLDYYFAHLLGLVALRAWDEGDANANLSTISRLLTALQGPEGSGQVFARSAETLILLATSHFEPDVTAYDRLLAKIERLDEAHRVTLSLAHAKILGCHLRFGLEVTCAGDIAALRDDNVPDYPWLGFALRTLFEAYGACAGSGDTAAEGQGISEALLIGLMPDAPAFLGGRPPDALASRESDLARIRELFASHQSNLLADFAAHRPTPTEYSPLSFTFNFPHNLVKGIVVDAARRGAPWPLALEDLVSALPRTPQLDLARRSLATTLMGYALANPDTIRGRPHPAIVCDPAAAVRAFEAVVLQLAAIS